MVRKELTFPKKLLGLLAINVLLLRLLSKIHLAKKWSTTCITGGHCEYWRNVKGCEGGVGDIEIHFVDSVVPGYFWIFPVNDEVANVGIGMVIGLLKKEKEVESATKDVIENHPLLKDLLMQK